MNATAQNKRYPALFLGLVLLLAGLAIPARAAYYIDANATGTPEDGSSWANAFRTIPTAVTKATGEFWVAEGVYTHTVAMEIKTNNFIYGGFTNGMTAQAQRDWTLHPTICDGQSTKQVLTKGSPGPVTLDGFILRNGGGAATGSGGALYVTGAGVLTINNCIFSNNAATARGGAIVLNNSGCVALFSNCQFLANNQSGNSDGGGAIRLHAALNTASFWDCSFVSNLAQKGSGGAISSKEGSLTLNRCLFANNFSVGFGGAISSAAQLTMKDCDFLGNICTNGAGGAISRNNVNTNSYQNCSFVGNASTNGGTGGGGAIYAGSMEVITLLSCTFLSNTTWHSTASSSPGGAIRASISGTVLTITNCLFWGDTSSAASSQEIAINGNPSALNLAYSSLNTNANYIFFHANTARTFGLGITNGDPLFASASYPYDAHLKSMAGRWDPALGQWVKDAVSSPCIDAGDPASDYSLEPPNNGGQINLGRYGNTVYASKSGTAARSEGAIIIIR